MHTYNVELVGDARGIYVIEAFGFEVTPSGALVFKGAKGNAEAFNAEKWIHVWKI